MLTMCMTSFLRLKMLSKRRDLMPISKKQKTILTRIIVKKWINLSLKVMSHLTMAKPKWTSSNKEPDKSFSEIQQFQVKRTLLLVNH